MKRLKIKWWKVNFNSKSANHIKKSIQNKNISQGIVTEKFEKVISKKLKINNTVMTNNGSIAILMALLALNLKKKDEIILQDRTWISTEVTRVPHTIIHMKEAIKINFCNPESLI